MSSDDWKSYKMGEIVDVTQGLAINAKSKHLLRENGLPLLRITDLFNDNYTQFISEKDVPKQCIAREEEIIYTRTGQVGFVFTNKIGVVHNNCFKVTPKNNEISREFVYWFLRQKTIREYVNTIASGSVQKDLTHSAFKTIEIKIPKLQSQKSIASIFSVLDNRITLLRETNTTFEAIAQALFKSWFVDFDPVRAKMDGREPEGMDAETADLFPDSFEESELGLIPKGWKVTRCQNIIDVRDGTHESPKQTSSGFPLITSRHITDGSINFANTYLISQEDFASISKRSKVDRFDVLITMIGTVGVIVLVLEEKTEFAIKNIGLFKTSANQYFSHYLYLLLKSNKMQNYLEARLAGTTQKYLSLKALREIECLNPQESVLMKFSEIVSSHFEKIHQNDCQAQILVNLRDILLPRLISGQLRLPEAETILEEI